MKHRKKLITVLMIVGLLAGGATTAFAANGCNSPHSDFQVGLNIRHEIQHGWHRMFYDSGSPLWYDDACGYAGMQLGHGYQGQISCRLKLSGVPDAYKSNKWVDANGWCETEFATLSGYDVADSATYSGNRNTYGYESFSHTLT